MIKTRNYVAKDTSIFCAVLLVSDSDVNNENESELSTLHPLPSLQQFSNIETLSTSYTYVCFFIKE